jgi:hypothetical protein
MNSPTSCRDFEGHEEDARRHGQARTPMSTPFKNIPPFHKDGLLNVVIETKKQCRNKYSFDEDLRAFRLKKILPFGMVYRLLGCLGADAARKMVKAGKR